MAIDTSFLTQLNRFALIVNKRVTSRYVGGRRSVFGGRGTTFKEHRIYAPGDDIRRVDWKVYARTDDLYVKRYEEDRSLAVHLLMDHSASMGFGSPRAKFDFGAMLALGFAYLATKSNEKFQFATFGDHLEMFRPQRGMNQLAAMMQHLNSIRTGGKTGFYEAINKYRKIINTRSFIVIISDFLFPVNEIEQALFQLGSTHDIKIIQVLDRVERNMLLEGDLRLKDSESGLQMRTFISQRMREEFRKGLGDHVARINNVCNQLGIEFYSATTDTPLFDVFFDVLKEK
ncbi:MAG: DUF58 domain-containing protein [Candidatus Komeilibacteria bacterium]|nr:DUF58 domain-containing protein [Candidatus Komeilibacteria bacterium]